MSRPWYDRYHYLIFAALLTAHCAVLCASIVLNGISWDEGWNFCVAKNWVLHNHYGCSFNGEFTTPRLSQGLVTVAPAALGFKLFGIGIVEGRIFQGLITLLALIALYATTRTLAGKGAALIGLLYLLGVSGDQRIHPGSLGGQGWGETTVILFVALGTLFLSLIPANDGKLRVKAKSLLRYALATLGAGICLGIACATKHQATPFVTFGLVAASLNALRLRDYKACAGLLSTWGLTSYSHKIVQNIPLPYQSPINLEGAGVEGIIEATALVFETSSRVSALTHILAEGWLLLVGLLVIAIWWRGKRCRDNLTLSFPHPHACFFLYAVCLSWLLWYLLAARPFRRYLGPPVILGTPFVAALLASWLAQRNLRQRFKKIVITALTTLGILNLALLGKFLFEISGQNPALLKTAAFLNHQLPPNTLIETYDTQLYFLLDQPFRYPPDQSHLAGITSENADARNYIALKSPAKIFVLGGWSSVVYGKLFQGIEESEEFECSPGFSPYQICRRSPK
jgi:hypothetical protein